MSEAYIIDACRTPVGKRDGGLSKVHPADLGAHADQLASELRRDLLEVSAGQGPQILRRSDAFEQAHDPPVELTHSRRREHPCRHAAAQRDPSDPSGPTVSRSTQTGKRSAIASESAGLDRPTPKEAASRAKPRERAPPLRSRAGDRIAPAPRVPRAEGRDWTVDDGRSVGVMRQLH